MRKFIIHQKKEAVMPPESVVDQALLLKKRARRRLVGAIALVIVMLIILPNVLKDKSALQERAPIKLTMSEPVPVEEVVPQEKVKPTEVSEPVISTEALPETINIDNRESVSVPIKSEEKKIIPEKLEIATTKKEEKKSISDNVINQVKQKEKKVISLQNQAKPISTQAPRKVVDEKSTEVKPQRFLIQVGVYSDEANVKQLQAKISEAGFTSHTAKLQTAKGEKIRLRVGAFVTREAAAEALKKIQTSGLPGMVLIDD